MVNRFRKLTNYEKGIMQRMLEVPFPGREQISKELDNLFVRSITEHKDNYGSIEFKVPCETKSLLHHPHVDAFAKDKDGILINYILFLLEENNKPYELEILRIDGKTMLRKASPSELKVFSIKSRSAEYQKYLKKG